MDSYDLYCILISQFTDNVYTENRMICNREFYDDLMFTISH